MHDPYDDEDDGYDDDHYNYDYGDQYDPYKFYFTFNLDQNTPLSEWISKMINDIIKNPKDDSFKITNIPGFNWYKFPVNSWNPNTDENKSSQYLGSNYQGQPIWKKKYFISQPIQQMYKNHIATHAYHFINQPHYYKGMFDILN